MANVTCKFCKKVFDRSKEQHVRIPAGQSNRYAHAECYLKEKEKDNSLNYEIINPTLVVPCIYCKKDINKEKEEFEQLGASRFAHKACIEIENLREKSPEEKLNNYIMKLFKVDYVPPKIKKQITAYVKEYKYTYSGIEKALYYFYELKGNDLSKANGGIGIIPYCYEQAKNYFYNEWLKRQKNIEIDAKEYVPIVEEVTIPRPQKIVYKSNRFSFLDDEVNE